MATTELAQAYVQIIPSAKGISGKITSAIDPESKAAGKAAGLSIASGIKKAIAAAGIGLVIKKAVSEGANLQQSLGGIDTLFKGSAETMKKYADDAYKTVGVSANQYMENVTSFSASLLQSLGGDTDKAAEIANMAMIDMGDNANKMGTDMMSIQNAYQGFAKQNYTMLDNLKLGYGGTKTEMERLLKDATKLSGVKYDISNLADVYSAINVMQTELGIAGTTALEAEETITGSLNAMKASFSNVLGKIALGEDIKPSLSALAKTVSTYLFKNLLPMVGNILSALPGAIVTFIKEATPMFLTSGGEMISSILNGIITNVPLFLEGMAQFIDGLIIWIQEQLPTILEEGVNFISNFASGIFEGLPGTIEKVGEVLDGILTAVFEFLPTILDSGIELIRNMAKGIWDNLPEIVESISNVMSGLLETIMENFPSYLEKGMEIISEIAKGIWDNLPEIIKTVTDLLGNVIRKIGEHLPEFLKKGLELIWRMASGLVKAIPDIVKKIPEVITAVLGGFGSLAGELFDIGGDLIRGLWNGIKDVKNWLMNKISGFVDGVLGGIKKFFGIKSPSKVMAKEVGKWLPEGLAVGIEGNVKPLTDTMDDLGRTTISSFDPDLSMQGTFSSQVGNNNSVVSKIELLISMLDDFLNTPPRYQMVLDNGVLVGELTPGIDKSLSVISDRQRRGG